MDSITDRPKSDGYNTIPVVNDQLTKMRNVIPCQKDLNARQFANLFMKEIVRLNSLTQYRYCQGDTMYLSPMEGDHEETTSRRKPHHGFPPENRPTNGTNQCHIATLR